MPHPAPPGQRIAITGLGIFCAAGTDLASFTAALHEGRSGIGAVDLFDVSPFPARIGAQVRNYDPHDHFDRRTAARLSRTDQFGLIAAREALRDSGITGDYSPYDLGVAMGGGAAGMYQSELWLHDILADKRARPGLLRGLLPEVHYLRMHPVLQKNYAVYAGTSIQADAMLSALILEPGESLQWQSLAVILERLGHAQEARLADGMQAITAQQRKT